MIFNLSVRMCEYQVVIFITLPSLRISVPGHPEVAIVIEPDSATLTLEAWVKSLRLSN